MPRKVADRLATLGVDPTKFASCSDVDEEWAVIKKNYFKRVLREHPDKGGDAERFRKLQMAFEALRALFELGRPGFLFSTAASHSTEEATFEPSPNVPSWEYYKEAAEEAVPTYKVERAKSGRSRCCAKGSAKRQGCVEDDFIAKDE